MAQAESTAARIATGEEIGSYRSLSALAVLSFVLGLLSIISFAPSWFFVLVFPPAAIVLGILAFRQISAAPEVYTGARLARFGIVLAAICAVGSIAAKVQNSRRIVSQGRIVADRFVNKLRAGDTEGAFWLKVPREGRASFLMRSGVEVPNEVKGQYVSFYNDAVHFTQDLASGQAELEFDRSEPPIIERGIEYAPFIYHLHSPKGDTHVLVLVASHYISESQQRSWYIKEFRPGYEPQSFEGSKGSSGHGHSH
jgi:hypothetical protein